MNNGKLKIEKNAEGMDCHIDGLMEKVAIARDAIIYAMFSTLGIAGRKMLIFIGKEKKKKK